MKIESNSQLPIQNRDKNRKLNESALQNSAKGNKGVDNSAENEMLRKAEKTASEFESLFLDIMMQSMRKTAQPEDQSNAQSIYNSMLDQEYSKEMSASHQFGIKEMIVDWIKANQSGLEKGDSQGGAPLTEAGKQAAQAATAERMKAMQLPDLNTKLANEAYKVQSKLGVK